MESSNQEAGNSLVDQRFADLLIDGYFAICAKDGQRPVYGYPANHLPEATGLMEVKTTFLA